jgi:hypothetical protein
LIRVDEKKPTLCSYFVQCSENKREIKASSYEELLKLIQEKFQFIDMNMIRIEYWSKVYEDWILLESLPEDKSKIQINQKEIE